MADQTIDELNIKINAEASKGSSGLDKLISSIERLQEATGGGSGQLTGIVTSIHSLTSTLSNMKSQSGIVSSLANSIDKLNSVKTNNISGSIAALTKSLGTLGGMDPTLKTMISDLATLAKSGSGSIGDNALKTAANAARAQAVIDQSTLKSAKAQEGLKTIAEKNQQIEETARAAAEQENNLLNAYNAAKVSSVGNAPPGTSDLGAVMPHYGEEAEPKWPRNAPSEINADSIRDLKVAIGEVGDAANKNFGEAAVGAKELSGAAKGASSSVGDIGKNARSSSTWMQRMVTHMLVGMVIYRGIAALNKAVKEGVDDMAVGVGSANRVLSDLATNFLYLKNSIGAFVMPILQQLAPMIDAIVDKLADFFNMVGMLTARLFGNATTVSIAKKATVDYAATVNKATDATQKQKQANEGLISGFDELNVVKNETGNENGKDIDSAGAGMPDYKNMFQTVKIPSNILGAADKIKGFIFDNLTTLQRLLKAFPLVLGAILTFSGNPALGIPLMILGAALLVKQAKEDWDYLTNKTTSSLDKMKTALAIVGAVELAVGAVLAFSGVAVGLGIALMAGGIATTAATLNWDSISPNIKKAIGAITFSSAVAMLALGAIFAFSGANIGLGVGLMIGGATTMWASATLNWNSMSNQLKEEVGEWTIIVSGALLALGAILLCTGNIGLGIGMIIGGVIGIVSAVALNWNSMSDSLRGTLTGITAIVGIFTLALGAALLFTGGSMPLGIALLAMGATSLATAAALNWDSVVTALQGTIGAIVAIGSTLLLAIGLALTFTGAAMPLGIGLLIAGAAGLATTAIINWNSIVTALKGPIGSIVAIGSTLALVVGLILAFTGVAMPLGIGLILVGAVGLGSTAALNWNAMKDKIKTVIADILAIGATLSIAMGLILCLTGAGIPLGVSLILAGAAGTAAASIISGKSVEDLVQGIVDNIVDTFNNGIEQITEEYEKAAKGLGGIGFSGGGGGSGNGGGGVRWNATGGIYHSPAIIGVAEAGPEAAVPLADDSEWIDRVSQSVSAKIEAPQQNSDNDDVIRAIVLAADKIAETVESKDTSAYLDGEKITKNVNKRNANRGYNLGLST